MAQGRVTEMEMANMICACFSLFEEAHGGQAVNCLEVAQYLDEQRAIGLFANNKVVNALYSLAEAESSTAA